MRYLAILVVSACLSATMAQSQSVEERHAARLVEDMASEAFRAVRGGSQEQRETRLISVIENFVDVDAVSMAALGPIWDELTPSQRRDFIRIYVEMMAKQYALLLNGGGSERYQMKDTFKLSGGLIRVRGEVTAGDETVPVGFIVADGFNAGIRNLILNDVALVDQDRQMFEVSWVAAGGSYSAFAEAIQTDTE